MTGRMTPGNFMFLSLFFLLSCVMGADGGSQMHAVGWFGGLLWVTPAVPELNMGILTPLSHCQHEGARKHWH